MPSKILHGTTILLVEDDEGFRPILTNYLISLGAKIIECRNFFQVKEQMARESPNLVLFWLCRESSRVCCTTIGTSDSIRLE
jgi:DNA-binding NtrC family response regulator